MQVYETNKNQKDPPGKYAALWKFVWNSEEICSMKYGYCHFIINERVVVFLFWSCEYSHYQFSAGQFDVLDS